MESLFFNLSDNGHEESFILNSKSGVIKRVDISQGLLMFNAEVSKPKNLTLKYIDKMAMIVIVKDGCLEIMSKDSYISVEEAEVSVYLSTKQDFELKFSKNSNITVVFVADFFIKRYLNGDDNSIVDFIYTKLNNSISLEELLNVPINISLNYLTTKVQEAKSSSSSQILRRQIDILELLYEIFNLLEVKNYGASHEELKIVKNAKKTLLSDINTPITVKELALICNVKENRLNRVFKKVTKTTIKKYLQDIRLQYAHILIKSRKYTMGQVAKKVGFKHQYYFSKLYYSKYSKSDK